MTTLEPGIDLNMVRAAVTLVSLVAFLGIVAWAYAARHRERFDAIAQSPLLMDDLSEEEVPHE